MQLGEDKYHLVLQNDTNSGGYTQWFNFRVSNGKRRGSVTFSIVNLVSLMRPSTRNGRCIKKE